MFKLQSGNPLNTPNPMAVLYQCVAAAAMHELQSQFVKDTTLLFAHQNAVQKWCADHDITIEPLKGLTDLVLKFHIIDERGLCKRLDALVAPITTGDSVISDDPLVQKILVASDKYRQNIFNGNFSNVTAQINKVSQMSESEYSNNITASYADTPDKVEIAFFEDGTAQCRCNYCKKFFDNLKKMPDIDYTTLNPLQQILATSYKLI